MPAFLADVLTWPGNRIYVTAIKAAREWSVPPSVFIIRSRQPSDGWTEIDKKLAIAFQILEDETCSDCGVPIWIGHSEDQNVQFEIKSRVCYSCAETETQQERQQNRKGKRKATKGKKHFVVTKPTDKMPSRQAYFDAQNGKVEDE